MALFEKKDDIFKLMEKFEKSTITELELEAGENFRIKLSKNAANSNPQPYSPNWGEIIGNSGINPKPAVFGDSSFLANESAASENLNVIKAPIIGTFYSAPSPEAEPYVKVGDKIKKGEILCILEAMKVMNDIECEQDCEILEILVSNGELVEYGQPMFKIK